MKGFSLLEVVITLFALTFGMLGLASLATTTVKRIHSTHLYDIATLQISAFTTDRITAWQQEVAELLPQGEGTYSNNNIKICWFDRLKNDQVCLNNE